jgi:hypothetical protein
LLGGIDRRVPLLFKDTRHRFGVRFVHLTTERFN